MKYNDYQILLNRIYKSINLMIFTELCDRKLGQQKISSNNVSVVPLSHSAWIVFYYLFIIIFLIILLLFIN